MIEQIIVPDIGEGVEFGKVVAVHLKVGAMVAVDDTVVELETDKAVVEIPAAIAGKVVEVLAREGKDLAVGAVIATVETAADTAAVQPLAADQRPEPLSPVETAVPADTPETVKHIADSVSAAAPTASAQAVDVPLRPVPASPSIRRIARELGVDIREVRGSGPGGRISRVDIQSHVKARFDAPAPVPVRAAVGDKEPDLPDFSRWGKVESVDLETVRRITAQRTAVSWQVVPHVTQFDKADITALDGFIRKNNDLVSKKGGKLTVTALVAMVCSQALKKFPRFNASIDLNNNRLIYKKYIHIGIAVDTPRGLLMPVIRNADTLRIVELAAAIQDLAERSRSKKIKPTELEGGTFSISNQGGIGGVAFTPIVLWPQAAILGISRADMAPKYVDGRFEPRKILPLSLSYDHRIIDGADAARFLRWVCESLENAFNLFLE